MKNKIYLRRSQKIILKNKASMINSSKDFVWVSTHADEGIGGFYKNTETNQNHIATILKNLEAFGYTLSEEIIDILLTYSEEDLNNFYKNLSEDLKELLGANKKYKPMYPNFPKQVMTMSDLELYVNAAIHYLGDFIGIRLLPNYKKETRLPLDYHKKLKVIKLGNENDFKNICKNLLASKTSISESDKKDLKWFIENYNNKYYYEDFDSILPKKIEHKEILAYLGALVINTNKKTFYNIEKFFVNATDVLRLCTALSEGDISLAENTKFKKFSRPIRKIILGLLDKCTNLIEDINKNKKKWLRLGEILHPFEYKEKYLNVYQAFYNIRNNIKIETFNSKLELAIKNYNIEDALEVLKNRGGEFARKLDFLIRVDEICFSNKYREEILTNFKNIANNVSTPVLLQVIAHFKDRQNKKDLRIFFPKGNTAKVMSIKNNLMDINKETGNRIIAICENTLTDRFEKLPSLGKVFIDEKLKNYLVPFSQRSANKALKTLVRGSKIDMPVDKILRFFLWWKEDHNTDRVDLDLSAIMYNTNWEYIEHVSYTNLNSNIYNACHSGDITSAPKGACEFIDIDTDSIIKYGGRYIVMSVYSYTGQEFSNLPECFAGFMSRKDLYSGEIFEPKTVENKIDITSKAKTCIPLIIDLAKKTIIWADLALKSRFINNVETSNDKVALMGKSLTSIIKPNLYDLFYLHALARGTITKEKNQSDTIFDLNTGITPFDIEKIMAEFL
ncbi:MAG: TerD family protein [Candidatus Sericytochromatia bacterium]